LAEQFYDAEMAKQQERMAATPDMRKQREVLCAALALRPGEKALDVGCGNGALVRDMLAEVGEAGTAIGVDSAETMIPLAKAICPSGDFRIGDAASLPFEDQAFDAVVAAQLLCFLPDIDAALREMRRVLKLGGRLVILDTHWDSLVWNAADRDLMKRVIDLYRTPYVDSRVPEVLSPRLRSAGFDVVERSAFSVLNWNAHDDTYAAQTMGFAEAMMRASDAFSDEDLSAWRADLAAREADGTFIFSLNRYIFKAARR
jgi:arsenite methyltransferase